MIARPAPMSIADGLPDALFLDAELLTDEMLLRALPGLELYLLLEAEPIPGVGGGGRLACKWRQKKLTLKPKLTCLKFSLH